MKIIIGADKTGEKMKDVIKSYLNSYDVIDVSENGEYDFVEVTLNVAAEVAKEEENLGIVIDAYGVGLLWLLQRLRE